MTEPLVPAHIRAAAAARQAAKQAHCGHYIIFSRDLGRQEYIVAMQPAEASFCPGQKLAWKMEPVANPHEAEAFRAAGWLLRYATEDMSSQVAIKAFALVTANGQVRPFRTLTDEGLEARVDALRAYAALEGTDEAAAYYARRLERYGASLEPQEAENESRLLWENHAKIVEGMIAGRWPCAKMALPAWFNAA